MPADSKTSNAAPRRGRPPKGLPPGTDLRAALVNAAALEIKEAGYHATTTNRIAARAGLSAGVFYNYFKDKVDVLLAVHEHWIVLEWELIRAAVPEGSRPTAAQTRKLVAALLRHHADWIRLRHAWVALSRDEPRVAQARSDSRSWQLGRTAALLGRRPSRKLMAEIALAMLAFEATADSIASGETGSLGVGEAELAALLARMLQALVQGDPPGRAGRG